MIRKRKKTTHSSPARKPHFFKVLLGSFAEKLRIPPKFVRHISKGSSKRVTLYGPDGGTWRVDLCTTPEGTFLSGGWPEFVQDHLLEERDFLVFRYDGKMHFSVFAFDESACEKEGGRPSAISDHDKELILCVREANCSHNSDTFLLENESMHQSSYSHDIVLALESTSTTLYKPKQQRLLEVERSEAQKAALSFSSTFPYFISRISPSSVGNAKTRTIPCSFSRAYFPPTRTTFVIRDARGLAWEVVYLPNPDKAGKPAYLSAGWSAFARANHLQTGDYCAFEVVNPAELFVTIFKSLSSSVLPRRNSSGGQKKTDNLVI